MKGRRTANQSRPRLRWGDIARALLSLAGATVGLWVSSWIIPDFNVGGWELAIVAALLVSVFGALLRPILDATAQDRIRELICDAWRQHEEREAATV